MQKPSEAVLAWSARAVGEHARVVGVTQAKKGSGPWLLSVEDNGAATEVVLKTGPSTDWKAEYDCEGAALDLAASHDLPVPRVIATQLDTDPVALLLSRVPGTTTVPFVATKERLRATGAAAAKVHVIPLQPSVRLPLRTRHMPWVDYRLWRRLAARYRADATALDNILGELPGWSAANAAEFLPGIETTPLLDEAERKLNECPTPASGTVFVHGDLWQGNTLWDGDECLGLIDWEAAGAGHYGVDLGCLRWDAALLFGGDAPDEILAGWEEAAGRSAEDVAYWDVVSALNAPADSGEFLPSFAEAGRTDLDGPTLDGRRDAFLESALGRLQTSA